MNAYVSRLLPIMNFFFLEQEFLWCDLGCAEFADFGLKGPDLGNLSHVCGGHFFVSLQLPSRGFAIVGTFGQLHQMCQGETKIHQAGQKWREWQTRGFWEIE